MTRQDKLPTYRLPTYRSERDPGPVSSDTEPAPDGGSRFVVQKHSARTLHYDFRLEADGVLKSWSIPKDPSADPGQRRMAVTTGDHPLEYADFEGAVTVGEYGACNLIVWDAGTYENLTRDVSGRPVPMTQALARGRIDVRLHGDRLTGGWSLTRLGGDGQERWLLVKAEDDAADGAGSGSDG